MYYFHITFMFVHLYVSFSIFFSLQAEFLVFVWVQF